ncbi:MAG TPA: hypothetical protein P5528_00845 [Steroidobacteraceae bacterium]|nr:hypothetical protein [Steroidobacteraceae bacterium]
MRPTFLLVAALATLLTAFAHSYFGEKRLIGPLVASNDGVMSRPLAKQVIRFAWHLTSALWVGQALLLLRAAADPLYYDSALITGIGILYLAIGLFDAAATRGRHIGWPLLTAIGLFTLLSLVTW